MSPSLLATALLTTGGLVWSWPAGHQTTYVELGERGGQVLVGSTTTTELRLFSSYDSDPPTPVWQDWSGGDDVAARDSDTYLSTEFLKIAPGSSQRILYKRTSSSPTPDWSYAFPPQFAWDLSLGISRDGRVIVSGFFDETADERALRVHDPATGIPVQTILLPPGVFPNRLALSPDGSVAAVSMESSPNDTTWVIDLATGAIVDSTPGTVLPRQGLSDQGGVLVVQEKRSNGWHARALVRQGCCYQEVIDSTFQPAIYPAHWAISDDGSTLAGAFFEPGAAARFVVRAFSVPSASLTMERVIPVPSLQNHPSGVAISRDGSRFVVGCWGDGNGAAAELAVYSPTQAAPLIEYPQLASVLSVDMSPDGGRFAAARALEHYGNGFSVSAVEMYEFGGEDLVVRGRPSVGSTVDFEYHATPGANGFLLSSPRLAMNPLEIPGAGTLVLGRSLLESTDLGIVPPSGVATHSVALANDPSLVGRTTWYQGLTTGPRRLSSDWIQLTILP